ncbi:MAG: zeta toxin family protein [Candidatus Binataceae bacterium]
MSAAPWLWLIAGPNGAGKSTYAPNLAADVEEIVRPDEIAESLLASSAGAANLTPWRLAIGRVRALFHERRSFAIETTFSGLRYPLLVQRAKSKGWKVGMVYIGVAFPELAIERVRQRVLIGGHDVSPAVVRRRYERSLRNLNGNCKRMDRLVAFDNSSEVDRMKLVFESHGGRIVFLHRPLPKWVRSVRDAMQPTRRRRPR